MSSDSASFQSAESAPPPEPPTLNLNKDASIEEEIPNPNPKPNPDAPKKRGRKRKVVPIETPPNYLFKFQEEELLAKSDQTETDPNQIKFKINDLVWGKVKSHPWWPGQIYDPSLASESALKIKKQDHFLIAYFGDKSFAWSEASSLQPYQLTFPKMEKQSGVESFVTAVNSSLAEISRRIELAFSCNCSDKKPLKERLVQNAGIIDGTHLPESDNSVILESFNAGKIINYVQERALFGAEGFNKLEFVMARAYLKAFDKYRGFPAGPEFVYFEEFGNNPTKINENSKKRKTQTQTESGKKRGRPKKLKQVEFSDEEYDPKSDSEEKSKIKIKKRGRPRKSKKESSSESDSDDYFSSESEEKPKIKKRGRPKKSVESDFTSESEEKSKPKKRGRPKKSKRVEKWVEFSDEEYSPKSNKPKTLIKPTSSTNSSKKRGRPKKVSFVSLPAVQIEYPSCSEMLAQLAIAAQDPVNKDYKFITQLLEFFSQYKNNNLVSNDLFEEELGEITKSGRRVNKPKYMKDTYWTDVVLDTGSDEENKNNKGENENININDKMDENENLNNNININENNDNEEGENNDELNLTGLIENDNNNTSDALVQSSSLVENDNNNNNTSDALPGKEEKDEGKTEEMQADKKANE